MRSMTMNNARFSQSVALVHFRGAVVLVASTGTVATATTTNTIQPLSLSFYSPHPLHLSLITAQPSWIRVQCLERPLPFVPQLLFQGRVLRSHAASEGFLPMSLLHQVRQAACWRRKREELMSAVLTELRNHESFLRPYFLAVKQHFTSKVAKLIKKHYMTRMKITKADKYAILDYTGPGYSILNRFLRKHGGAAKDGDVENLQERVSAVEKAMAKRGLGIHNDIAYRGMTLENEADFNKFKAQLKVGGTFQDPGFLSTSKNGNRAFRPTTALGVWFVIRSKTGVDVAKFSHHPREEEVLFRPNTLFKIQRMCVVAGSKALAVVMEEIA